MGIIRDIVDHGLECLKKASIVTNDTYPTRYSFRTVPSDSSGNEIVINDDGQLKVVLDGKVDANNTTKTLLTAGQEYTGTSTEVLDYGIIFVTVYSDVASATDGLHVEFSSDGTTWREGVGDRFTVPADTEKTFSFQPHRRYFRVHYLNGGSNQGVFDLEIVLKKTNSKPSSHRISDSIVSEDDAELVKAVLTGENPSGDFINFSATNGGNFKVSIEELENGVSVNGNSQLKVTNYDATGNEILGDPKLAIARGLYSNIMKVNKYGLAPDGVQTTPTDIWDRANAAVTQQLWVAPTQARIHAIVSTSTADDGTPEGAGAGAQAVRVYGLQTWATKETSEIVILDGTTPVNTVNSYVIIHRMKVIEVGATYNLNVGIITATAAVDGSVTAQINAGSGQTLMAIYGIPSSQKYYIANYVVSSHQRASPNIAAEVDFEMLINERPDLNETVFLDKSSIGLVSTGSTNFTRSYNPYYSASGPAIIKFQGIASAADIEGAAEFDIILIDN